MRHSGPACGKSLSYDESYGNAVPIESVHIFPPARTNWHVVSEARARMTGRRGETVLAADNRSIAA